MSINIKLTSTIPAKASDVYSAWLDSKEHARMTESNHAVASDKVGATYTAHNEYVVGKNLELIPNKKIVQSWRNTEFKKTDPDSILEVRFKSEGAKTLLTLIHKGIPEHEAHVKQGWKDYYFEPMKRYFIAKKKGSKK